MKFHWVIVLTALMGAACASPHSHSSPNKGVYLDAIAIENGMRKFPDPIHPERLAGIPKTLYEAIDALKIIVPIQKQKAAGNESCLIRTDERLSDAYTRCVNYVCQSLPPKSRLQGCGYFIRLEEWVQLNWLGGYCAITNLDKSYPLTQWFLSKGITDCSAMSELIMIGYTQSTAGLTVNERQLILHSKIDSGENP